MIQEAVDHLMQEQQLPQLEYSPVQVSESKSLEHGDYTCNFALVASKLAKINPKQLGENLKKLLSQREEFDKVEVAGPGFINIYLNPQYVSRFLYEIQKAGSQFGAFESENPKKINVEFVSVNPNGPITIGSGRGAAFGDTLCRVLEAAGHTVHREYYINDGVNSEQMQLFAKSVEHYIRKELGEESEFPEGGYRGDYVWDVAQRILKACGKEILDGGLSALQTEAQNRMIERQKEGLQKFGVVFDTWFSEQSLHDTGQVQECLEYLTRRGVTEEKDGALWLKSTEFGDDKDRVLVRQDGRPTYIAPDIAYHKNKYERGYDYLIDIMGPDHHGYIGRMTAGVQALGYSKDRFQMIIYQIVRFLKDGKPAPMRKRDGNIYELVDLIDRVGKDIARFFFLVRSHDTHMDFDIDLATEQSDENPVFYVQYAHARICSILDRAKGEGFVSNLECVHHLVHPKELGLIKKILELPNEIERCSIDFGVHRLTTYAVELARTFHHFYDACKVIQPEYLDLTQARLALCEGARIGLQGIFRVLGISASERMERPAFACPTS